MLFRSVVVVVVVVVVAAAVVVSVVVGSVAAVAVVLVVVVVAVVLVIVIVAVVAVVAVVASIVEKRISSSNAEGWTKLTLGAITGDTQLDIRLPTRSLSSLFSPSVLLLAASSSWLVTSFILLSTSAKQ